MPDQEAANRGTFVPPTPPKPKPKGSTDNSLEMGAGGVEERNALDAMATPSHELRDADDARGDALIAPAEGDPDLGRTDNPQGTGIGFAGEGAASYGTQGATGDDARLGSSTHPAVGEHAEQRQEGTRDV